MTDYIRKTFTYEGKRYTVRGKTEKEAIMKMANKIRDLEEGNVTISGNTTVRVWGLRCIDVYKTKQKDITREKYKNKMENAIFKYIGERPLKQITPIELQEVLNKQRGSSVAHIRLTKQMIQFIFKKAKSNKLILNNPAEDLVEPDGYTNHRRQLTNIEREHFLKVTADNDRFLVFLLTYYCGCRPEEARNCKGKDIQVMSDDNGTYYILHIEGTKSSNADRFVPIPDEFYQRIKNTPPFDYIALNANGKKHSPTSYKNAFNNLRREMNISMGCRVYRNQLIAPYPLADDFVPYNLRHTYCCDLQKAGVDIRTAQHLMGHSSITLTANIYTHADNTNLFTAARMLGGAKSVTPNVTPKCSKMP